MKRWPNNVAFQKIHTRLLMQKSRGDILGASERDIHQKSRHGVRIRHLPQS